jgi:hypothetical protein
MPLAFQEHLVSNKNTTFGTRNYDLWLMRKPILQGYGAYQRRRAKERVKVIFQEQLHRRAGYLAIAHRPALLARRTEAQGKCPPVVEEAYTQRAHKWLAISQSCRRNLSCSAFWDAPAGMPSRA